MLASIELSVIYPVAILKVNVIKYRTLLDTSSGSSHGSEAIIDLLKLDPVSKEYQAIET